MADYLKPGNRVFQDFAATPVSGDRQLRLCVIGGNGKPTRFANADEKADGLLGYYDHVADTDYLWPNKVAGSVIDDLYTKVFIDKPLLKYFEDGIGSGGSLVRNSNNRIRSTTHVFGTNDSADRSAAFLDRDVKAGDIVKVRGVTGDSESVTLWTTVKKLVGEVIAATVSAVTLDTGNPAAMTGASTTVLAEGEFNGMSVTGVPSAGFGHVSGAMEDTIDVIVTGSSVGGDLSTATLRLVSGSGFYDDDDVSPTSTGLGSGTLLLDDLTINFHDADTTDASQSASDAGVSTEDLLLGQRFRLTVNGTATGTEGSGADVTGTYTGDADRVYCVEVTRGGDYTDTLPPQVTVFAVDGTDSAGPFPVASADATFALGTYGAVVSLDIDDRLHKGSKFYFTASAETEGALRTIELTTSLDEGIADGTDLEVTLHILQPSLEVTEEDYDNPPDTHWSTTATEVTVNAGLTAYDDSWTDDGDPVALPVVSSAAKGFGKVYVEYRQWLPDHVADLGTIADIGDAGDIAGPLDPDNPLKWGVRAGLLNSAGTEVRYLAIADPSSADDWADALGILTGRDDIYNLVAMTDDTEILALVAAHVASQSTPTANAWRKTFVPLTAIPAIPLVSAGSDVLGYTAPTTTDDGVCLATIADDPDTSGTQYTIVHCAANNGDFITNGVIAGDILRAGYTTDGFGGVAYDEYVIDEVLSDNRLRLAAGPVAAVSVASKIEIWRTLSASQEAAAIAVAAGTYASRRVCAVWPDTIESAGGDEAGYILCAALGGLASGVPPQQGLTRYPIAGFTSVNRTTRRFKEADLDVMAKAGVWIVTRDARTGAIHTRHAVTSAGYDIIEDREEMFVRCLDFISYRFRDKFEPYVGVTNVTPSMTERILLDADKLIEELKNEGVTVELGPPLISVESVTVAPDLTNPDRYIMTLVNAVLPFANNGMDIHIQAN